MKLYEKFIGYILMQLLGGDDVAGQLRRNGQTLELNLRRPESDDILVVQSLFDEYVIREIMEVVMAGKAITEVDSRLESAFTAFKLKQNGVSDASELKLDADDEDALLQEFLQIYTAPFVDKLNEYLDVYKHQLGTAVAADATQAAREGRAQILSSRAVKPVFNIMIVCCLCCSLLMLALLLVAVYYVRSDRRFSSLFITSVFLCCSLLSLGAGVRGRFRSRTRHPSRLMNPEQFAKSSDEFNKGERIFAITQGRNPNSENYTEDPAGLFGKDQALSELAELLNPAGIEALLCSLSVEFPAVLSQMILGYIYPASFQPIFKQCLMDVLEQGDDDDDEAALEQPLQAIGIKIISSLKKMDKEGFSTLSLKFSADPDSTNRDQDHDGDDNGANDNGKEEDKQDK